MFITVELTVKPKQKKATGPDGLQAHVLKDSIKKSFYKVIPVLVKKDASCLNQGIIKSVTKKAKSEYVE